MGQITIKVDEQILAAFYHTIYSRSGLKREDPKESIEQAMKDYIKKYGRSLQY